MKIQKNIYSDIHRAIIKTNYRKVKELLENKISPNKQTGNKNTPLHIAVMKNNLPIIKLLQKYHADPNLKNSHSATPLHIAAEKKNSLPIMKQLLKLGANINHTDRYGNTALHIAIRNHGNIEIIKLLLKSGANPIAINNNLETPLSIARNLNNSSCIQLLSKHRTSFQHNNILKLLKVTLRTTSKLKKIILVSFSITVITTAIIISALMSETSFMGIVFAIFASLAMAIVCLGEQCYKIYKLQINKQ